MNKQTVRRRVKKRKTTQKSGMKFTTILGIMVMAVLLGYLTARFVIGPFIGYEAEESPAQIVEEEERENEEEETSSASLPTEGYALQFGVFSTREAAQSRADELEKQGIEVSVVEADQVFKIIGQVVGSREEAFASLEALNEKDFEDVFITSFE